MANAPTSARPKSTGGIACSAAGTDPSGPVAKYCVDPEGVTNALIGHLVVKMACRTLCSTGPARAKTAAAKRTDALWDRFSTGAAAESVSQRHGSAVPHVAQANHHTGSNTIV